MQRAPYVSFQSVGRFWRLLMCGCRHTVVCSDVLWRKQQCWGGRQDKQTGDKGCLCCRGESEHPGGLSTGDEHRTELHLRQLLSSYLVYHTPTQLQRVVSGPYKVHRTQVCFF